jgi:hypothetical protein
MDAKAFQLALQAELPRGRMPPGVTSAANDRCATGGCRTNRWRAMIGTIVKALCSWAFAAAAGSPRHDRHVCTIAGSRGSKGVSFLIPNLLSCTGSEQPSNDAIARDVTVPKETGPPPTQWLRG